MCLCSGPISQAVTSRLVRRCATTCPPSLPWGQATTASSSCSSSNTVPSTSARTLDPRPGNSSAPAGLGFCCCLWGLCTCHCTRGAAPVTLQSSPGLLWVCVSCAAQIPALQSPVVTEQDVREFVLPRNVHRALGDFLLVVSFSTSFICPGVMRSRVLLQGEVDLVLVSCFQLQPEDENL